MNSEKADTTATFILAAFYWMFRCLVITASLTWVYANFQVILFRYGLPWVNELQAFNMICGCVFLTMACNSVGRLFIQKVTPWQSLHAKLWWFLVGDKYKVKLGNTPKGKAAHMPARAKHVALSSRIDVNTGEVISR